MVCSQRKLVRRWLSYTGSFLAVAILILVRSGNTLRTASAEPRAEPACDRPNILLFVIDTLRADRVGCYGYSKHPNTPNLDSLARQGVVFEQAYAPGPWTLPSIGSVVTARWPCTHGALSTQTRLAETEWTLAEALHAQGYTTIGLFANFMVGPEFGFDQGYALYQDSLENSRTQVHAVLNRVGGRPFFLYVHNIEPHNPYLYAPSHTPGFPDVGADLRERMAEHYVAYRSARRVDFAAGRTPGATDTTAQQDAHLAAFDALRSAYSDLYDAAVHLADARFGAVLDALHERGVLDDTLVVVISDHGEEFGEHGGWMHDQSVYEELIRVPFILRLPGAKHAGTRVESLVSLTDLMPTLLEFAQTSAGGSPGDLAAEPAEIEGGSAASARDAGVANEAASPIPARDLFQGRSLLARMASPSPQAEDLVHVVSYRENRTNYYRPQHLARGERNVALRKGAWKGIWNVDIDTFELYDLARDPGERRNLAQHQPDLVASMRAAAAQWLDAQAHSPTGASPPKLDEKALSNLRTLGYID